MATAQQEIFDRILQDLHDDKGFENVTVEKLFYYLNKIKDIIGSGASITNGSTVPTGGADGDYYIQTTIANQIWYNNAGVWSIILSFSPITADYLTLAQLGADSEVIEGQVYKYVDAGFLPASIGHILLTGSGTQTYNNIGQAYVTAIGKYVECDYDLATNDISGEYVLWCADLDQSGESDPTISILHKNISGETPTLTYIGYGEYSITFTNDQLVSVSNCDKISGLIEEPSFAFTGYASDSNTFTLKTFSSGGQSNGIFLKTTIKIIIQLKPN